MRKVDIASSYPNRFIDKAIREKKITKNMTVERWIADDSLSFRGGWLEPIGQKD